MSYSTQLSPSQKQCYYDSDFEVTVTNIIPFGGITCFYVAATALEVGSMHEGRPKKFSSVSDVCPPSYLVIPCNSIQQWLTRVSHKERIHNT